VPLQARAAALQRDPGQGAQQGSAGAGATMRWEGNRKVGTGAMTITESKPVETIRLRLDFEKPMKATNAAEFIFKAEGDQTSVIWNMTGRNNFGGKIFGLFINCEKMVGGDFEKGLAALAAVTAEKVESRRT